MTLTLSERGRMGGRRRWGDQSIEARFWSKVQRTESGCWLWVGAKNTNGYGRFWDGRRGVSAHVWSYADAHGSVPAGMELDHLCRTPACVNPGHLEPVSHRENLIRGIGIAARNARVVVCPRGHPYDEANTIYQRRAYGVGRSCRECKRARDRQMASELDR